MCACTRDTGKQAGPMDVRAVGPLGWALSLLLCSLYFAGVGGGTRKGHAACTPPSGGLGNAEAAQRPLVLSLSVPGTGLSVQSAADSAGLMQQGPALGKYQTQIQLGAASAGIC